MPRYWILAPALVLALGGVLAARAFAVRPPDSATPVLVELFTSEGCSSCPPADQVLIDLVTKQPVPGARIVALGEHVDYWDQLGWKDPFSAAAFTRRQSDYASAMGAADIYTPQIVVDGRAAVVGSDRASALAAIRSAAARTKPVIQMAWTDADRSAVAIDIPGDAGLKGARVRLAVTEDGLASEVRRGENQGRTLTHAAVTRQLADAGTVGGSDFHEVVSVSIDPAWHRDRLHVIVFAQRGASDVLAIASLDAR